VSTVVLASSSGATPLSGLEIVSAGGTASSTTLSAGGKLVLRGGTASNTVVLGSGSGLGTTSGILASPAAARR
jgi:autotransporter passenger strand-loop-strand repeat protein